MHLFLFFFVIMSDLLIKLHSNNLLKLLIVEINKVLVDVVVLVKSSVACYYEAISPVLIFKGHGNLR